MGTKYSARLNLPSCAVEISLLRELEKYLRHTGAELMKGSTDADPENLNIKISDSLGTEGIQTINDFWLNQFPNDTTEIAISYTCRNGTYYEPVASLDVQVSFKLDSAELRVEFVGSSAREFVTGRCAEISGIVRNYRNLNVVFHPVSLGLKVVIVAIQGTGFGIAVFALLAFLRNDIRTAIQLLSLCLAFLIWRTLEKLRPYCVFESRRMKRFEQLSTWFILTFVGFLLFGVFGRYITKELFGF